MQSELNGGKNMGMIRGISEEQVLTKTLEKINRHIGIVALGSKRHTRLRQEKTNLKTKQQKRLRALPDR